ncbi:hypothetical protein [Sneathiella limimaris]|uniref:hypothetical protein n=1 Tax=Sneathiella limimaris TaxID=1964213 RepID=UPI00146B0774|nr:hypothetical protein [Sneathiella limimaris]
MMRVVLKISVGVMLLVNLAVFATGVSADEMIELRINGPDGEPYAGDCYLRKISGDFSRQRIGGKLPAKLWLPTTAFRCNIEKKGALQPMSVEVIRGGTTEIVKAMQPPFRWIAVRSSGPWGKPLASVHTARPTFSN